MPLQLAFEKISDILYKATVTDDEDVLGKHYALAVDIYDSKTYPILISCLDTMNRHDVITLMTFGDHLESVTFPMTDSVMNIVTDMTRRKENGCNIAMALYELDRLECDERIVITSGEYNDGPTNIELKHKLYWISPAVSRDIPSITIPPSAMGCADAFGWDVKTTLRLNPTSQLSCRKLIRKLLKKDSPSYYNIKLEGAFGKYYLKAIPPGGMTSVCVPYFEGKISLKYLNFKGETHYTEINK